MTLRILDEATAEFENAIVRYENIETGLGIRFKQDVKAAAAWIGDHPELPVCAPKAIAA